MNNNVIIIKQIRSSIGIPSKHKLTLIGLGLRHIGHIVKLKNTPSILGMINKIKYMIQIKEYNNVH